MLSVARSNNGYGPNPIMVSEVLHIADHLGIERDEALYFIQGLDFTWLTLAAKKLEAQRPK